MRRHQPSLTSLNPKQMQSMLGASIAAVSPVHIDPQFSLPDRSKKSLKPKGGQQKHQTSNHQTKKLYFPKSTPTPILINPKPQAQTKLQALESIVDKLEASIQNGVTADTQTYSSLLETCFHLDAVDLGVRVHRLIPPKILRKNPGIASKLVRLYAVNGKIEDAHELFDLMSGRDESAFAWNALISGYAELGKFEDALALYFQMEEEDVEPDRFTFPRALKACSGIASIVVGEEIHRHIVRFGFSDDGFVLNSLVDMYAKCGDIVKATKVFDKIDPKDLVSWNSMITGYLHHGLVAEAVTTFRQMLAVGAEPDGVTMSSILSGAIGSFRIGRQVHGWVLRRGEEWRTLAVDNSLISLYSYHGKLVQARWLFDQMPAKDIVSWNSIISAHCRDFLAFEYFSLMERYPFVSPDNITFVSLLTACAHLGLVRKGEGFFSLMEKYGISPVMEHYACLVNLYGRAGMINMAYEIVTKRMDFEAGPTVWGALLNACYLRGNVDIGEKAAHELFELEPDNEHNFELLIKIYKRVGRLDDAKRVQRMSMDRGLDLQLEI